MKRQSKLSLLILVLILWTRPVFAESIKIMVENQYLNLEIDPIIENGHTLVPARAVFENLGASVEWQDRTKTVEVKYENRIIQLIIDDDKVLVDGKGVKLDQPAKIVDGRTLVPVRFIGKSLGAKVDWDGVSRTVLINSDKLVVEDKEKIHLYKVVRVEDGDTLTVNYKGKVESIRLIGIDAPESVHPVVSKNVSQGKIASDYLNSILYKKEVGLELDIQERDQYGRILAYVWLGDIMLNEHLLEIGYAQLSTYPPNVKYVDDFIRIQKEARENDKGFWDNNSFVIEKNMETKESTRAREGIYKGSIKSDKYHKTNCKWAKSIRSYNEIWFKDKGDAKKQGYNPCGYCNP